MTSTTDARFNLVDTPWIMARYADGTTRDVSLRTAFHEADAIRELAGELPTQAFAITRLMIAILVRAVRTERDELADADWREFWNDGLPLDEIDAYLDQWYERFWLLHPERPFFQVADLATAKGEMKSTAVLIADLPSNNRLFTTRSGDDALALSLAEAARWLVNTQAFDASGIKSGDPRDPRVKGGKGYPIGVAWSGHLGGLVLEAATLAKTLLLNTVSDEMDGLLTDPDADIPVWERDDADTAREREISPEGAVQLFTWQSRRIRLVANGDRVSECLVCNGDALTPQNQHVRETMTAWRFSDPQTKKMKTTVYMPREHRPERALWRGISALLPQRSAQDKNGRDLTRPSATVRAMKMRREYGYLSTLDRIRVHAIGVVYGSQSAVVDDITDDSLVISPSLFEDAQAHLAAEAENAVHLAEEGVRALRNLAENLTRAAGGSAEGSADDTVMSAYEALGRAYPDWLERIDASSDPIAIATEWRRTAHRTIRGIGLDLVDQAGPAAWAGREVSSLGRTYFLTAPLAESWFRTALRKTFGDIATTEKESA